MVGEHESETDQTRAEKNKNESSNVHVFNNLSFVFAIISHRSIDYMLTVNSKAESRLEGSQMVTNIHVVY